MSLSCSISDIFVCDDINVRCRPTAMRRDTGAVDESSPGIVIGEIGRSGIGINAERTWERGTGPAPTPLLRLGWRICGCSRNVNSHNLEDSIEGRNAVGAPPDLLFIAPNHRFVSGTNR